MRFQAATHFAAAGRHAAALAAATAAALGDAETFLDLLTQAASIIMGIFIGLVCWGKFNRKPMGFYHQIGWAFRLKFSHHPIL